MVLITLKTLQQETFSIEAIPSDTVAALKLKVQAAKSFEPTHQKLIFKGKILADDITVESSGLTEKDFVVCMVTKPKAVVTVATTPIVAKQDKPATVAAPIISPVETVVVPSSQPANSFSSLATGTEYESAVANLLEMGFVREDIVAAMRAAFNNPDRAAEYLMTGIPESARIQAPATTAVPTTNVPVTSQVSPGGHVNLFEAAAVAAQNPTAAAVPAGDNNLEFLRNSPQFAQLRQLVQTQPHLLQPLLQQLGQTNPQLLQLIQSNQDQFLGMLAGEGGADLGLGEMLGEGGEGGDAEQQQYITVTPEEDAAIARLVSLGFERNAATEAFFACDKNEELAANYLFENGQDWQ